MGFSSYPLVGLVHTVAVVRQSGDADDGAGGIVSAGDTSIVLAWLCRIATLTGDNEQVPTGLDGPNRWYILGKPKTEMLKDDIIIVGTTGRAAIVCPAGRYRILWLKQQIDDRGRHHHTSVVAELI